MLGKISKHAQAEAHWLYSKIRGRQTLSIDGVTAHFHPNRSDGGKINILRYLYEKDELIDLLDELRVDDVFYDVGANTGLYTCLAAQQCTDGKVVAFEPYPPNVRQLHRNIVLNSGDIQVMDVALSDSVGSVNFNKPATDSVGYGKGSISEKSGSNTEPVPTVIGDKLIEAGDIPQPNVVKIDVEGVESLVVQGLQTALSSDTCRVVYCEVHLERDRNRPSIEDYGMDLPEFKYLIQSFGFELEVIEKNTARCLIKASR